VRYSFSTRRSSGSDKGVCVRVCQHMCASVSTAKAAIAHRWCARPAPTLHTVYCRPGVLACCVRCSTSSKDQPVSVHSKWLPRLPSSTTHPPLSSLPPSNRDVHAPTWLIDACSELACYVHRSTSSKSRSVQLSLCEPPVRAPPPTHTHRDTQLSPPPTFHQGHG
jgi:hypothetical protein